LNTSFDDIVQKILDKADIGRDELMARIRKKQEELSGFITPEGAATIVGREFGIVPERKEPEIRKLTIDDLSPGMSNVDIIARVIRVYEPREFERRDGSRGQVANLILQDKSGQMRGVLWDKQASLVKEGKIQKAAVVQVQGAYVKQGRDGKPELNLGLRGSVNLDPDDPRARELPPAPETKVKIADLSPELSDVDVIARVVAVSEPRTFERSSGSTGKVAGVMLADGSGQTRGSLWDEKADIAREIKSGSAIKLENAYVREGWRGKPELHLGWRGRIILDPADSEVAELPEVKQRLLKVEEIETDMPMLDVAARVRQKFPPQEFKRDDGKPGRVMNVILIDETGSARASFWDDMVDVGQKLSEGDVVLLRNARSREGLGGQTEIRVGRGTEVRINPEDVEIGEFKPSQIKLGELEPGGNALDAVGRVTEISEPREFTRPDGSKGRVASAVIADQTGSARVSLWHDKADMIGDIKVGDVVGLKNCYSAAGLFGEAEIHVGKHGQLEVNPPTDQELPPADALKKASARLEQVEIGSLEKESTNVQIQGTIARVFHRRPIFDVCPECGRSLGSVDSSLLCEECGKVVTPEHRVVLSFVVDDGTGNIRAVLFGKVGEDFLSMDAQKVFEMFKEASDLSELYGQFGLVGREVILTGTTRRDKFFDQLEIRVRGVQTPDPKEEARALLAKIKA
jgi:replication factor A1